MNHLRLPDDNINKFEKCVVKSGRQLFEEKGLVTPNKSTGVATFATSVIEQVRAGEQEVIASALAAKNAPQPEPEPQPEPQPDAD